MAWDVPDFEHLWQVVQVVRPLARADLQARHGNYAAAHAYLLLAIEVKCRIAIERLNTRPSAKGTK